MNRTRWISAVVTVAVVLAFSGWSPACAEEKAYLMAGKISAIDMPFQTVVIEVPLGDEQFTVGGPLSPDAVLTRGGRSASLSDFQVGDAVSVVWRATAAGHVIQKLTLR